MSKIYSFIAANYQVIIAALAITAVIALAVVAVLNSDSCSVETIY